MQDDRVLKQVGFDQVKERLKSIKKDSPALFMKADLEMSEEELKAFIKEQGYVIKMEDETSITVSEK